MWLVRSPLKSQELFGDGSRKSACLNLGRTPEARASYEKALAPARQEPERRFLARRLEELKKSPSRMLILSVRDDYRMNDRARKAVLLARTLLQENIMPQYPVAGYLSDDFDPSQADEALGRDIHALNKEMIAAGVRVYACGLSPASNAKSLRPQPDGGVLITDGPYLETKEHIGGFWILETADMDQAVAWARKGVVATRGRVEVREIFFNPPTD
jgi:hypothetical protein